MAEVTRQEEAMGPVRVDVRLFGAFRKYSTTALVSLDVPRGTRVAVLRELVGAALRRDCPAFHEQELLEASAVADDERILPDEQPIGVGVDRVSLAVLPPVCGG
jgi:sulfur-carrier protein